MHPGDTGAALLPAAAADDPAVPQAADPVHAQEPAAAQGIGVPARGIRHRQIQAGQRRLGIEGHQSRQRETGGVLQRQDLLRPAGGTQGARPERSADRAHRPALSVSARGPAGPDRTLSQGDRDRVVPGRTAQPGGMAPHPALPAAPPAAAPEADLCRPRFLGVTRCRIQVPARPAAEGAGGAGALLRRHFPRGRSTIMLVEVKVPQLSESVAEATLLTWHKKPGDAVKRDENLVDIETDKVVLETPAPDSGVIVKIIKGDGSTVTSNELIAQIDTESKGQAVGQAAVPAAKAEAKPAAKVEGKAAAAMPAAQRLAAEKSVDPTTIAGTGRGGRVTKEDVIQAVEGGAQPVARAPAPAAPVSQRAPAPPVDLGALGERAEQRVPMSRLRARIAERLVQSQHTAAMLTTFNEANMQPVIELRKKYQDRFEKEHGVKLGFMSFFVKAVVHALKKYPVVNASIDGTDIVYHGYYDIGIAVGSPRGLVVPIVRDADQMSFAAIEKKIAEFGKKAQDGKLSLEDLTGGTFSISNGGVFGSMLSTPIINPPQSAILGVHATKDRAVVENGQIVVRPMNYLAMSYDHRIIDGREAVLGLVAMKEALEDPARLLFDI